MKVCIANHNTNGPTIYLLLKISKNTSTSEEDDAYFFVKAGSNAEKKYVVDYTTEGVGWYKLGTFNFTGGGNEYIKIKKI